MRGAVWKLAKRSMMLVGLVLALAAALAIPTWLDSDTQRIQSAVFGQSRTFTVFNSGSISNKVILVLDGERARHGLATAVQARLLAFLKGQDVPMIVAIDSQGSRDVDFRNAQSDPAEWRPVLAGRADRFDRFLIDEIIPQVRKGRAHELEFYLFGHSLGGLYAIDLATRQGGGKHFAGFAAFTPTLSHDRSVLNRLPLVCAGSARLLATIGFESAREHRLFEAARQALANTRDCHNGKVAMVSHPGMIHQVVMLTGQTQAIYSLVLG